MRVLVYSAVFGGYDAPKSHAIQTIPADYPYFTEDNDPYCPAYLRGRHPRLIAKYYKLRPYAIRSYSDYDYVIWLDGSATLLAPNALEDLIKYCRQGYAVFKHPQRDCIYDEAEFCRDFEKYRE